MIGDNESNFPHNLLLTNRQVSNLCKAFAYHSSTILSYQKLGPLLKTGLPLIKNVIKPFAKSLLIPLGLTAVASAGDAGIYKKILGSGNMTTLIISNDEIKDIIKIVKFLEDSGLLLKEVAETVQNEQKGGFLSMSLGTLGASLLGNLLTGKRIYRAGEGQGIKRAGEGIVRAGYGNSSSKMDF